jgi:hypothetical protein
MFGHRSLPPVLLGTVYQNEEPKSKLLGIFFLRSMDFMRGFITTILESFTELKPEQTPWYELRLRINNFALKGRGMLFS